MKRIVIVFILMFSVCQLAYAREDFFGIKVNNARDIDGFVIEKTPDKSLKYSFDREKMDDRVKAWAKGVYFEGRLNGLNITFQNKSDKPIPLTPEFMVFSVVTTSGEIFAIEPKMRIYPPSHSILPGKKLDFGFSFWKRKFKKEEVKMIVCSFGLRETEIVLLPADFVWKTEKKWKTQRTLDTQKKPDAQGKSKTQEISSTGEKRFIFWQRS